MNINCPLPWNAAGLTKRQREIEKAAFAVQRGYRAAHYSAEYARLICEELAAGNLLGRRHKGRPDSEGAK